MSMAFAITEEDIVTALVHMKIQRPQGMSYDELAEELFGEFDAEGHFVRIEKAALDSGVDMDEQTEGAMREIEVILKEMGFADGQLPPNPAVDNDETGEESYIPVQDQTVWRGDWLNNWDGTYETRPSVAQSDDGFLPGLEVSYSGGDSSPSYGESLPTLEQAIEAAKTLECDWHQHDAQSNSEVPRGG